MARAEGRAARAGPPGPPGRAARAEGRAARAGAGPVPPEPGRSAEERHDGSFEDLRVAIDVGLDRGR